MGAAAAMLVVSTGIIGVLAVHDETFQLDGNVDAATTPPPAYDWDSIFTAAGVKKSTLPSGYTAATFQKDFETTTKKGKLVFATHDGTTFTTGSKDTLDINPGWQCAASNNLLSKNDIMNAYAVAYTDDHGTVSTADDEQFMYFGLERNSNNGDANVAFWFLQGGASCDPTNGTATWSGNHADGDLLIVSAFTNGGGVSGITAYRWTDTDGSGPIAGFLDTSNPAANGGDCNTAAGGDPICATTNGSAAPGLNAAITTPWQTANTDNNVGNTLQPSEFFEGGINLTNSGFGNKCFNTFVGDTRSSQSPTATIFDYASGQLGECKSTTTTNPVSAADTTQAPLSTIPGDPNDAKVDVKDKTIIDVTGVTTFAGTISWHICGPTASTSTDLCTSGGVNAGSQNITADGTYYSPTVTVTAAGRYCFRADFTGDSAVGVPGSSDSAATECFTVAPLRASISTTAGADVEFGQPVTDSATLSSTAHQPGTGGPTGSLLAGSINPTTLGGDATGQITFTLYKADCTTPATGTGTNPQTVNVSGNGTYGPVSFTPDAPGTYHWVATYGGDTPNTLASLASQSPCPDTTEDVVVSQIPSQITTAPSYFPQDSATVTSSVTGNNLPAGGTVVFRLYNSSANCALHGSTVGQGGLLYAESVTLGAAAHSQDAATNNQSVRISGASSALYWRVTYATGDTAHTGRQSDCVENITSTIGGDSGPGTLFP